MVPASHGGTLGRGARGRDEEVPADVPAEVPAAV
jgi:hypothetical protein